MGVFSFREHEWVQGGRPLRVGVWSGHRTALAKKSREQSKSEGLGHAQERLASAATDSLSCGLLASPSPAHAFRHVASLHSLPQSLTKAA